MKTRVDWIKDRTCYVIMPFSATVRHIAKQWTEIFEKFFKPTQNLP